MMSDQQGQDGVELRKLVHGMSYDKVVASIPEYFEKLKSEDPKDLSDGLAFFRHAFARESEPLTSGIHGEDTTPFLVNLLTDLRVLGDERLLHNLFTIIGNSMIGGDNNSSDGLKLMVLKCGLLRLLSNLISTPRTNKIVADVIWILGNVSSRYGSLVRQMMIGEQRYVDVLLGFLEKCLNDGDYILCDDVAWSMCATYQGCDSVRDGYPEGMIDQLSVLLSRHIMSEKKCAEVQYLLILLNSWISHEDEGFHYGVSRLWNVHGLGVPITFRPERLRLVSMIVSHESIMISVFRGISHPKELMRRISCNVLTSIFLYPDEIVVKLLEKLPDLPWKMCMMLDDDEKYDTLELLRGISNLLSNGYVVTDLLKQHNMVYRVMLRAHMVGGGYRIEVMMVLRSFVSKGRPADVIQCVKTPPGIIPWSRPHHLSHFLVIISEYLMSNADTDMIPAVIYVLRRVRDIFKRSDSYDWFRDEIGKYGMCETFSYLSNHYNLMPRDIKKSIESMVELLK
jgi:hypothetical protein